jgi:hypothetical protein
MSAPQSVWDAVSRLLPRVEWDEARRALGVSLIEGNVALASEAAALVSIVSAAEVEASASGSAGFERTTLAAQVAFFVEGLAARRGVAVRARPPRGPRARSPDGLSSVGSCASAGGGDGTGGGGGGDVANDVGGATAAARDAVSALVAATAPDENGCRTKASWLWADASTITKLRDALRQEAAALAEDIETLRARLLTLTDVRAALSADPSDSATLVALRARKAILQQKWIALEAQREAGGAAGTAPPARSNEPAAPATSNYATSAAPSRAVLRLHKALADGEGGGGGGSGRSSAPAPAPPVAQAPESLLSASTAAAPSRARAVARGPVAGVLRLRGAQGGSGAQALAAAASAGRVTSEGDERFFV